MLAKDIMIRDFVTIDASAEVHQASKRIIESKIDDLPVCNTEGKVVGMVGAAEIIDLKSGLQVYDIMVRTFISVNIDATMEEIASLFIMFEKLRLIPVFEEQKLVGVINRQVVLKALNNQALFDKEKA
jgi:Predicted transcriptional regulator, contains C-terminal CBS domains